MQKEAIFFRRWTQFSLRTLLLSVALLALVLGIYTDRAQRQKQAVMEIKAAGGQAWYGDEALIYEGLIVGRVQFTQMLPIEMEKSAYQQQMLSLCGHDYIENVTVVELEGVDLGKCVIPDWSDLAGLKMLTIVYCKLPSQNVLCLHKARQLRCLSLENTPIGDDEVMHFYKLQNLRDLNLKATSITDKSMTALGKLHDLHVLDISETRVTDAGIAHISNLKKLKYLNLNDTEITDACLISLKRLADLKELIIHTDKFSEFGAKELVNSIPGLEVYGNFNTSAPGTNLSGHREAFQKNSYEECHAPGEQNDRAAPGGFPPGAPPNTKLHD